MRIDSRIMAAKHRSTARKISILKKTDFRAIREDTDTFQFETDCTNQSVEQMWQSVHQHLTTMMEKHGPTKTMMERHGPTKNSSTKHHQPRINNNLKRRSRRKYRSWRLAKTTNKTKDWERYKIIKKETRQVNRRAHQKFVKKHHC